MAGSRRLARRGPRPFADVPRTWPHDGEPDVHRLGRLVCDTDGCDDHHNGILDDRRRGINQELPLVCQDSVGDVVRIPLELLPHGRDVLPHADIHFRRALRPGNAGHRRPGRSHVRTAPFRLLHATTEAAWLTTLLVAPVALTSLGWVG